MPKESAKFFKNTDLIIKLDSTSHEKPLFYIWLLMCLGKCNLFILKVAVSETESFVVFSLKAKNTVGMVDTAVGPSYLEDKAEYHLQSRVPGLAR